MRWPLTHVHDLLQIDPDAIGESPARIKENLLRWPWVVVRRETDCGQHVAVGVRGASRNERWGGLVRRGSVRDILRPHELLLRSRPLRTPALIALQQLRERWRELRLLWGPIGSVGFELATGCPTTREDSDLDIVISAPIPLTKEHARAICDRTTGLDVKVDIRVETPRGAALLDCAILWV
jgi:phosphoribosyl-dephospho-CoA transferase